MKAVLMSIKPKWCEKIFSGEKTVEVRKTAPQLATPFKVYVYETKTGFIEAVRGTCPICAFSRGKVIGEFICDKIDRYPYGDMAFPTPAYDGDPTCCECGDGYFITCGELEKTCLEYEDLENYGKSKTLYGWHITEPKLFDKPKELGEFYTICNKYGDDSCGDCPYLAVEQCSFPCDDCVDTWCSVDNIKPITRAPQSWQYVEVCEDCKAD